MENTGTFEEIVKKTSAYVYSLSYRLTGSGDEAKDLMQETYLRALRNLRQARNPANPIPWIRKICLNLFIDAHRRKNSKNGIKEVAFPAEDHCVLSGALTPEQELVMDEDVRKIRSQCFSIVSSRLGFYQRIAFVLVDIFRLDVAEVSSITGKSPASVKSLLHRARSTMNRHLGSTCGLVRQDNLCRCRSWVALAHDVHGKRELLKELMARRNASAATGETADTLKMLYQTLPYLKPPDRNRLNIED
jgi:RNA polymerase sigma-70 factor (ECF subfamily)